ncbi:MAG: hypothetical protein QOG79_1662, partial [Mycobacterium sp.]|nr:hypothetical protein [Mycobacterium sp.]
MQFTSIAMHICCRVSKLTTPDDGDVENFGHERKRDSPNEQVQRHSVSLHRDAGCHSGHP